MSKPSVRCQASEMGLRQSHERPGPVLQAKPDGPVQQPKRERKETSKLRILPGLCPGTRANDRSLETSPLDEMKLTASNWR